MAKSKDLYEILGIKRGAEAKEIKAAYRRLAKKLHPDLNPGNKSVEQQFKEVSQAYAILGDPDKRARYDRGEIDASGQETAWRGGFYRNYAEAGQGGERYSPFGDFSAEDIFSDLFGGRGGRRARRGPARGADVSYTVPVDFLDAAVGARKRVRLADGRTLDIAVPAGTEDRQTLRLKGQGMSSTTGGPSGDAFVEVHLQPHAFFTRKDNDVHLELPITLDEALIGATVKVPTVHGSVSMKIPAGSNSGTTLRLKGKGIVDRKSGENGDQYVKLKVVLPDSPNEELRDFVQSWAKSHPYNPRRKAGME